jgi:hypothetical protein
METHNTTLKPQNKRRRKERCPLKQPTAALPNDVKAKENDGQFEMSMIDKSQVVQIVKKDIVVTFD